MDVRCGGIDAELHVERAAEAELREQFLLADDLRSATAELGQLFFGGWLRLHEERGIVTCGAEESQSRFSWPLRKGVAWKDRSSISTATPTSWARHSGRPAGRTRRTRCRWVR